LDKGAFAADGGEFNAAFLFLVTMALEAGFLQERAQLRCERRRGGGGDGDEEREGEWTEEHGGKDYSASLRRMFSGC
jgi:hypothetical protein